MLPGTMQQSEPSNESFEEEKLDTSCDTTGSSDWKEELLEEDAFLIEALQNYRTESLAWAERHSATMGMPRLSTTRAWRFQIPATALVAGLAILVSGLELWEHQSVKTTDNMATTQPSAQVIASDNLLLSSVSDALDQDPAPTEQQLGIGLRPLNPVSLKAADRLGLTRHAR